MRKILLFIALAVTVSIVITGIVLLGVGISRFNNGSSFSAFTITGMVLFIFGIATMGYTAIAIRQK